MPSMLHEGLLLLFRNRPMLAPELLRDALGAALPAFTEARVESAELTQLVPTEYRADLVVLLLQETPVLAIVLEVQLTRDETKRNTWPLYLASLRARLDCPTCLLVVTADEALARWAAQPIALGHPGFVLRPQVVGPSAVPVVVDAAVAGTDPELAVLSAMAHGQAPVGLEVARAVLAVAPALDDERARLYLDLVGKHLNAAAKAAFEALMQGKYEYQSDFARKYYGQGREEGREEGRCEGARAALVLAFQARGISLDTARLRQIDACADLAQLRAWLRLAVTAVALADVFPEEKPAKAKPVRRPRSSRK